MSTGLTALLGTAVLAGAAPARRAAAQVAQSHVRSASKPRGEYYDVRSPAMPRPGFAVTSSDVRNGGMFTKQQEADTFGCSGGNVSPQLSWTGAPAGTRSFAVTMFDPDAPTGSGFWHWVVYNIPASTTSLASGAGSKGGATPSGAAQATTDYGAGGFGGAP